MTCTAAALALRDAHLPCDPDPDRRVQTGPGAKYGLSPDMWSVTSTTSLISSTASVMATAMPWLNVALRHAAALAGRRTSRRRP